MTAQLRYGPLAGALALAPTTVTRKPVIGSPWASLVSKIWFHACQLGVYVVAVTGSDW